MKVSRDYSELIAEINMEIDTGTLKLYDEVQILRGDALDNPIIDWYYSEVVMDYIMDTLPDDVVEQYYRDKDELKVMLVCEFLGEMKEMDNLIDGPLLIQ